MIKIKNKDLKYNLLVLAEIALLFFLVLGFAKTIKGGVGVNATVLTYMEIANVYPEVINVSIDNNAASIVLAANSTKTVYCNAIALDYNGDNDITNAKAELYHALTSSHGGVDSNNSHYTNLSCNITYTFGTWNGYNDDGYNALVNCTFDMLYYSNPGEWRCAVVVNDSYGFNASGTDNSSVSDLLAVGLPNSINYGRVNVTTSSDEVSVDVINYGNVMINLSLSGYARTVGDGYAMNCSQGVNPNISIYYEKYNVSDSNPGVFTLEQLENIYSNLSSSVIVRKFNLDYKKTNDEAVVFDSTYWRMYLPRGAAGNCSGKIVFGATKSAGV
ncbi:MAG: hypothetical protein ACP5OG_05595 [Candidatus Nanoarchaeia archaeon]